MTISSVTIGQLRELEAVRAEMQRRKIEVPRVAKPWIAGWTPRSDGHIYQPSGQQLKFHNSTARFRALVGGRGSGKTTAGAQEALQRIRLGQDGAVLNPDFENFKFSTWPEFTKWIPWEFVVERDRHRGEADWQPHAPFALHFVTGSTVWCKGIKEPDSARGPNISFLWYDEGARDKTGQAWALAIAGVRVGENPVAWVTTTPRGLHHWLGDTFVRGQITEEVQELLDELGHVGPLYEYFQTSIHDNKANLDPLFYASMLTAYVGWMREQELEGAFVEPGGVLAERHWFEVVDETPADATRARYWDFAATEKKRRGDDPDWTAGLALAKSGGTYYVEHVVRLRAAPGGVEQVVRQTTEIDGVTVRVGLEQEPGASGKSMAASYVKLLDGFSVRAFRPTGDKVTRAMPWLAQAQAGNVKLVAGAWTQAFLDEVEGFPDGAHDDQVDAMSGAYGMLCGRGEAAMLPQAQDKLRGRSRWSARTAPRWKRSR